MAGKIVEVTDSSFETVVKGNKLLLVDFWAPWCGPCRRLTDENVNTATRFGVMSIPTLIVFKDGQKVDALIGAHPKENILASLNRHMN
jgi:thioredoxin 1